MANIYKPSDFPFVVNYGDFSLHYYLACQLSPELDTSDEVVIFCRTNGIYRRLEFIKV